MSVFSYQRAPHTDTHLLIREHKRGYQPHAHREQIDEDIVGEAQGVAAQPTARSNVARMSTRIELIGIPPRMKWMICTRIINIYNTICSPV